MSITINLPPRVEARLTEEARRTGTTPERLVTETLTRDFGGIDAKEQKSDNSATIALLNSWLEEGQKPRSPEELEAAEEELRDLMRSLNQTRRDAGERLLFPEEDIDG